MNNNKKKLPVKHVKSVGAAILNDKGRLLIVFQAMNKYWELPKGKVELGEKNELTTLKREIQEEVGIKPRELKIIKEFKYNLRYKFILHGQFINKNNVFYLATTKKNEITISDEHTDYKWVSLAAANRYFKHKNQRILIYKLRDFLKTYDLKLEDS